MLLADTGTQSAVVPAVFGLAGAALPGVLVALLSHYLSTRRAAGETRQRLANARALVALEFDANRASLNTFWTTVNALDPEPQGKSTEAHLAAMTEHGLLSYTLPEWSFVRWDAFAPESFGALTSEELVKLDSAFRDLRAVTDMYTRMVTLTPQEQEYVFTRFGYNQFAGWRTPAFERLAVVVDRVLNAKPLRDTLVPETPRAAAS